MGLLALTFLNYRTAFAEDITREYMRVVEKPIVALGSALQFMRGILFAIAFTHCAIFCLAAKTAG